MRYRCQICGDDFKLPWDRDSSYFPLVCSGKCFAKLMREEDIYKNPEKEFPKQVKKFYGQNESKRSQYEVRMADLLDRLKIKYQYEPYIFTLSDKSGYLPDFYLPRSKIFLEVKGLKYSEGMIKFKRFCLEYCYRNYLVPLPVLQIISK